MISQVYFVLMLIDKIRKHAYPVRNNVNVMLGLASLT